VNGHLEGVVGASDGNCRIPTPMVRAGQRGIRYQQCTQRTAPDDGAEQCHWPSASVKIQSRSPARARTGRCHDLTDDVCLCAVERPMALPPRSIDLTYLGDNVRLNRLARRMTQRELADRAGLAQAYVCRLERHQWPSRVDHVNRLAEALGVKPSDLLRKNSFRGVLR
jgi:DNA-binding Xre family transcriptional regulator